ncbi:MAG: oxidoreductase [Candidatus Hydrogenedentota bacterium]
MAHPIRWGILGTGAIARKFAKGLQALPDIKLAAVGSRTQQTAESFAEEYGFQKAHPNYIALAQDPDVDVIYISTPHHLHCENTLLCLRSGKHVLCEKPFAINAGEARRMIAEARKANLFLMEAMWTRFIPVIAKSREWIRDGRIGDARLVHADFGFQSRFDPQSRLFNPAYGGGSLLDVGVYPISFASMVFGGGPDHVSGAACIGETGVDEQAAMTLRYPGGRLAALSCAVRVETPHDAWILGTEGKIRVHAPFWCATAVTLHVGGEAETVTLPHMTNGYEYQAMEVVRCIRNGEVESPVMPLDESLIVMETMDHLRHQWGLKYPME